MLPYKRPAGDKSGIPMYQPGAYQQLMQPYVPVSCEYSATSPPAPEPKEKAKLAAAALNYTGVSLNKQVARGYAYPFAQPYPTMPPVSAPCPVPPYLLRQAYPTPPHSQSPMLYPTHPIYMASHMAQMHSTATTHTTPTILPPPASVTSENNNTSPQPYKKMKTS